MYLRLFTNTENQWFAKTMMNGNGQSRKQFHTDRKQHSFNDVLVYWLIVVLSYWFTTAKHQIKVSAMGCGFRWVKFGWCKSVAQCIRLSMWRYTNVKRL